METVTKILNYILDYIASVPAESWYVLGSLLASSSLVIGIVGYIKRRHLKKYADDLGRTFVTLNVIFWSAISTVLSFILTNGTTFAHFLPFLGTHMPQIIAISTVLYNIAKPSLQWFKDRQANKVPFAAGLPDLKPVLEQIQTPVPTKSFGTEAAGVDRSKLLQL